MSASINSCCTPCAAAPVPQPVISGGGDATTVAPEPVAASAPEPGAQPAPPAADVSGGGPGAAGTGFEPAPDPVQCGQWIPAPGATAVPNPAGVDGPPEPIAADGPGGASTGLPGAPASMLASWPQWQAQFTRLGVSPGDVAKLGDAPLSDAQLAKVYEDLYTDVVQAGGTPGQPITTIPASTWNAGWEQRFAALGLPAAFIAELRAEALRTGAGDEQLAKVHAQLAQASQLPGAPGKPGAPSQSGPVAPAPTDPTAPAPGTPDQSGPGWNPQVEAAFRGLGMPDEIVSIYAQSGAPLSGLEAAYKHAAARLQDFTDRGWTKRFTDAGVPAATMWHQILGDQPAKDADLEKLLAAHAKGGRSMWQRGGQLATSIIPGGRLVQYALGREAVSKDPIDRTKPLEIGYAALSALSLVAAVRGVRTLGAGWSARSGGYLHLNAVDDTLGKLGLPATGAASMEQAAMGATQTWGFKQKLLSAIPGTKLHRQVVGLGHAEAAARAFNTGGAERLLAASDGKLQLATLSKVFNEIKTGAVAVEGGRFAYVGQLRKSAPMVLSVGKDGSEVIRVAKNLKIGNGASQLVGLSEIGGAKLGSNPQWLSNAAGLVDDVAARAHAERGILGKVMAGSAARTMSGSLGADGLRPMRYIAGLQRAASPDWYTKLAALTATQWPAGALSDDMLAVLATHRTFAGVFGEAGTALAALDRAGLDAGVAKLVDDAQRGMDEAKLALDAAKGAGAMDEAAGAAVKGFTEKVAALKAADPALAQRLFPTASSENGLAVAFSEAVDAVQARHAAEYAAKLGAGAADDAAKAGTSAATATTVTKATTPAAASDAAEGALAATAPVRRAAAAEAPFDARAAASVFSAPQAPATASAPVRATQPPVALSVNARGEAVTPAGLVIPSYTAPVSGLHPADASRASVDRMAQTLERMRRA